MKKKKMAQENDKAMAKKQSGKSPFYGTWIKMAGLADTSEALPRTKRTGQHPERKTYLQTGSSTRE